MIKIIKVTLVIFNVAYFFGVIWFVFADITWDVIEPIYEDLTPDHNLDYFMNYYKLEENSQMRNTVISCYFAFTTLSTVGFGDFHPESNIEKWVGTVVLLLGVAMFSFLLGQFIEILEKYQALNAELEDADNL